MYQEGFDQKRATYFFHNAQAILERLQQHGQLTSEEAAGDANLPAPALEQG
jgi:hypothetical protein